MDSALIPSKMSSVLSESFGVDMIKAWEGLSWSLERDAFETSRESAGRFQRGILPASTSAVTTLNMPPAFLALFLNRRSSKQYPPSINVGRGGHAAKAREYQDHPYSEISFPISETRNSTDVWSLQSWRGSSKERGSQKGNTLGSAFWK